MPADKPAFLNGVDEENTIASALEPEETTDEKPTTQDTTQVPATEQPTETPTDGSKKIGEEHEDKLPPNPEDKNPSIDKDKGNADDPDKDKKVEGDKPPVGGDSVKKEEVKTEPSTNGLVFGKYKSIEEAEKGYKELEGAFSRATNTINAYRTGKMVETNGEIPELKRLIETPMIAMKKVSAQSYTDNDGVIDLDRYMNDYTRELVLGIQKSFLGGPLAAVQFDMLKSAMLEEHSESINQANRDRDSMSMTEKLYNEYPILKENKEIEELVSNAITGAKMSRANKAKAEGKEYVDFTYDEYAQIISRVVGAKPPTGDKTEQDPIEKIRPQSTITTTQGEKNEMEDIIDGMSKVTDRAKLF